MDHDLLNSITFYNQAGEITGQLSGDDENLKLNKKGNWVYGHYEPDTHYIKDGKTTVRPNQQTKLIGLTLTDLPVPCTIYINEQSYECDSDTAELEFDQPTSYEIKVESWPYLEWSIIYENKA